MVTIDHDGEQMRVAVSKTEEYKEFETYTQISENSQIGKEILSNSGRLTPGYTFSTGAKVVSVDFNFIP